MIIVTLLTLMLGVYAISIFPIDYQLSRESLFQYSISLLQSLLIDLPEI